MVWPVSVPTWLATLSQLTSAKFLCLGNAGVATGERRRARDHPLVCVAAGGGGGSRTGQTRGPILVTGRGPGLSQVTGVERETHGVSTDINMRVNTRHDTTVVMVGDTKVGKSALVNKFRTGKFESGYNKTNFESFNTSSIVSGQRVKFTIYDTSGWFHIFN